MTPVVSEKLEAIADLSRKHGVTRLLTNDFDPQRSDLDFLVEFEAKSPADRANSYFGLLEDLERLLGLPVDLVEPGPISNPYFRAEIERTSRPLYEAA